MKAKYQQKGFKTKQNKRAQKLLSSKQILEEQDNYRPYQTCFICYADKTIFIYKCRNCQICDSCEDKWIAAQIDRQSNDPNIKSNQELQFKCSNCQLSFTKKELDQKFGVYPATQQSLLKFYMKRNQEYQSCPSSKCKNIGWMDKPNCKKLKCNECNYEWSNSSHAKIFNFFRILILQEFFTKLFKLFLTKNCPKCVAPIYKIGGCKKMKCSNCNNYFCWMCKQYGHYNFSFYCFMICLIKSLLVIIPLNSLLFYYGIYGPAINQLTEFFIVQNFFYEQGFISLFIFIFRFVYKNGLPILIIINFFEYNISKLWRLALLIDWIFFTRWIEVGYYILIVPQIVLGILYWA